MTDLNDGESTRVKGSGSAVYTLKNTGGVFSCTCPAWRNQSEPIERRTCKHLRRVRGDEVESARVGGVGTSAPAVGTATVRSEVTVGDTNEPPLLLAHRWESDVDLRGWWLSEKLDGVRAYWNGRQFISRLGNPFHAPDWFTAGLPSTPFDGELWGGRKQFQRTVGIVKRQDKSPLWKDLKYIVFDAPAERTPFEARMQHCKEILGALELPHVSVHEHNVCCGLDHLREELTRVEGLGGEGLMARRPGSLYEIGRSTTLLKVKTFHDAEARVVAHSAGAGRHAGRVGALVVELENGTRFNVGTGLSDAER